MCTVTFRHLVDGSCAGHLCGAARRRRYLRFSAFLVHERTTMAMNSASVSHLSFKKPDVIHTAVHTEYYVYPPAPMDVNVAPPLAATSVPRLLSASVFLTIWNILPLIQHIGVTHARASTAFVSPHVSMSAGFLRHTDLKLRMNLPPCLHLCLNVGSGAPAPEIEVLTEMPVPQVMEFPVEIVKVASLGRTER